MSSVLQTSAIVLDELDVKSLRRKRDVSVSLEGPKRLGYFSMYENYNESVFRQDKSALRYLDLPDEVDIDCLSGYDETIKYGQFANEDMNLLRWVLDNEETMEKFPSDFICSDGALKDIMLIKYDDFFWDLIAIKIKGKIVLNKINSTAKEAYIDRQTEQDNKSTYAACKLQRLITKNRNGDKSISVKENDAFYGVFHSKIGSHRILHSGFLCCVESQQELDKPFEDMKFVLIKKFNAPRKSRSAFQGGIWWSLASLAGVDTIVCAKCEQDFTVKNTEMLNVDDLTSKRNKMILVATLDNILDFIKSVVKEENKCYNFHFNGNDKKLTAYMEKNLDENIIPFYQGILMVNFLMNLDDQASVH